MERGRQVRPALDIQERAVVHRAIWWQPEAYGTFLARLIYGGMYPFHMMDEVQVFGLMNKFNFDSVG